MRTTRTITASLAAVLGAAALAGPAAAVPADSAHNVYVPPATYPMKAHVYVPPASLATTPDSDIVKANVYVPPASAAPVQRHVVVSTSSSDFDWDSAGIGAGAAIAAALAGVAAAVGLRRRRPATSS
jgi:MYXO-CTERM domain-containing protein